MYNKSVKKVIWAEGVLLGQQHLQQWDNYHQNQQKILHRNVSPLAWGLTSLKFESEALLNGSFSIAHCQAIYPDGTLVQYDSSSDDYKLCCELQTQNKPLSIYLCMPLNHQVAGINGYQQTSQISTWNADYQTIADLYDSKREREVMYGKLNLILRQEHEDKDQFYTLKVIELNSTDNKQYNVVNDYIPTVIHIGASTKLQKILARAIETTSTKIHTLTHQHTTEKTKQLLTLQALTIALNQLQHLATYPSTHPQYLFLTLSSLVKQLLLFNEGLNTTVPNYQHTNLTECFGVITDLLEQQLQATTSMTSINITRENESRYSAAVDDAQLKQNTFFIAVYFNAENTSWIEKFARQIKVGTKSNIEQLITAALPGIGLQHIQHPPSSLFIKPGYEYFKLKLDETACSQITTDKNITIFIPYDFISAQIELITVPKTGN